MADEYSSDPLFDMFLFETTQNIEQIEQLILNNEKSTYFEKEAIDEVFRIMHTIKGSSAMMQYTGISTLTHKIEDLFFLIREKNLKNYDFETLSDLMLESVDFIKAELCNIKEGTFAKEAPKELTEKISEFLAGLNNLPNSHARTLSDDISIEIKDETEPRTALLYHNEFKASFFFEEGCQMENIRAFDIIHKLGEFSSDISYEPRDIMDSDLSIDIIREKGFKIFLKTDKSYDEMEKFLKKQVFLKELELLKIDHKDTYDKNEPPKEIPKAPVKSDVKNAQEPSVEKDAPSSSNSSIISVNVMKLDKLMDLLGELVISEAMVIHNPDLLGLELENFQKASQQLRKITSEMQDLVMSIRMVPLTTTLQRMNRIVRDMSKKLNKEVKLEIVGDETEVDKNIVEHISDPLMHLVRNAVDHGIESADERIKSGKPAIGSVTLEARNEGSDVLITVFDDGKGLDKEKILKHAEEGGLLTKPQNEMSEKEIFSLILLPGFSTNDKISEFSGRGVGMDVVVKNIETVGGRVFVESTRGKGTEITMRFPLTLAIIEGMNIRVGSSRYTIPITDIKESFRPKPNEVFCDPDQNEMIMVRGNCYPVIRLHKYFQIKPSTEKFQEGIIIMAEYGDKTVCLFADELLGQQEVVVKAMPKFINKINGLSGCTLLGDGQISLILDIGGMISVQS